MSVDTFPSHSAAILFEKLNTVSEAAIKALLNQHLPAAKHLSSQENSHVINLGGIDFAVMCIDQAYPIKDLEEMLPFNYTLKDGKEIINNQHSHIIISVLTPASNQSQAINQAITLTHLLSVFSQLADIQTVLWMNSGILQNPEMFNGSLKALGKALAAQNNGEAGGSLLPMMLWVGMKLYSPNKNEKELGIASIGLRSFTDTELDILPVFTDASDIAGKLISLVSYQFQTGSQYRAGETLDIADVVYDIQSSKVANTLSISLKAGS
jgi:hypothetical protein